MSLYGTALFHLNLQYSSIEVEARAEVVARCYRPLLGLLDEVPGLRLAIEASAATLEAAADVDPAWVDALRARIASGDVELVGSGDTQLIGPLVPEAVHRWNQRLGMSAYEVQVGARPRTALVNEMAWSRGVVAGYLDAGYETLVMEWNNPRRAHPEWEDEWRYGASVTRASDGRPVRLLWADAVAFQQVQRAAHGDLEIEEAAAWFLARAPRRGDRAPSRHVFLYASDAEVLDYRPGRYAAERRLHPDGEWSRLASLLRRLGERGVLFTTPSRVAKNPSFAPRGEVELGSVRDPVPVKKQPKYNVTRWALSGRDDVGLNARCFAEAARLERARSADPEAWRRLCRLWSSDLRTHLTERRWKALRPGLPARGRVREVLASGFFGADGCGGDGYDGDRATLGEASKDRTEARANAGADPSAVEPSHGGADSASAADRHVLIPVAARVPTAVPAAAAARAVPHGGSVPATALEPSASDRDRDLARITLSGRHLQLESEALRLTLNLRRGLAVESLAFPDVQPAALCGTIPHGALDDIRLAADFYTGHTVLDEPGHRRVTDLEPVEPRIERGADAVTVAASVPTPLGALTKRVLFGRDRVRLEADLSRLGPRPLCSLRAAHVTLFADAFGPDLAVTVAQGGAPERFPLDAPCDHTRGIPPLVTASAACGATDGRLIFDDGAVELTLTWDPGLAAALPLLIALPAADGGRLIRVAFSLAEVDDTFRAEGDRAALPDFAVELSARRIAR